MITKTDMETRLEGLKVRLDDQIDTIEKVEDDVEYIENQSRRNNIKILGVEEDNTTEKSWDDTEQIVKTSSEKNWTSTRRLTLNLPIE